MLEWNWNQRPVVPSSVVETHTFLILIMFLKDEWVNHSFNCIIYLTGRFPNSFDDLKENGTSERKEKVMEPETLDSNTNIS